MNAIERPATRGETFRCGFNQGINLGSIKSGMSSIQFKIGCHYQDCFSTLFVYFNRRPHAFDIGTLDRHSVRSLLSAKHTTVTTLARPPVKGNKFKLRHDPRLSPRSTELAELIKHQIDGPVGLPRGAPRRIWKLVHRHADPITTSRPAVSVING